MVGETIEPTKDHTEPIAMASSRCIIEPASYCFAGMDGNLAVAVVGPSEIGSDC
jgi:hypothetical protein